MCGGVGIMGAPFAPVIIRISHSELKTSFSKIIIFFCFWLLIQKKCGSMISRMLRFEKENGISQVRPSMAKQSNLLKDTKACF
jgi:hypothetical protein